MRIYRCLVSGVTEVGQECQLSDDETRHLFDVLRVSPGDRVEVLDGSGTQAQGEIIAPKGKRGPVFVRISSIVTKIADRNSHVAPITLEIAAIKGDGMEWVLEKATELGVDQVVPLITDHTVIQLNHGGPEKYQMRWQKVADQSLKQCGRLFRLKVLPPVPMAEYLAIPLDRSNRIRLWANEMHTKRGKNGGQNARDGHILTALEKAGRVPISLLVGPEGGWSLKEIEHLRHENATEVHLGGNTLRAETAALYGISLATVNWV